MDELVVPRLPSIVVDHPEESVEQGQFAEDEGEPTGYTPPEPELLARFRIDHTQTHCELSRRSAANSLAIGKGPWPWPDWVYAGEDGTFDNRYDDPAVRSAAGLA